MFALSFRSKIASILVLLIGSAAAQAGVIVQTKSFNVYNTSGYINSHSSYASDSERVSRRLTFDRFDASLGTLDSVSITLHSGYRHYLRTHGQDTRYDSRRTTGYSCYGWGCYPRYSYYYHDTIRSRAYSYLSLGVSLLDPSGARSLYARDNNSAQCTRSGYSTRSYCYGTDYDYSHTFNGAFNLASVDVNRFIGNDALDLNLFNNIYSRQYCSGYERNCRTWSDSYWNGRISVTYNYSEAVPEPATLGLSLFGLAGLYWARRRRNQI